MAQLPYEATLKEAFAKAQQTQKMVFVKYYNRECSVCKTIQDLLDQPMISQAYQEKFVCYAIDTFDELSPDEAKLLDQYHLHFSSVPMFVFFDQNQQFIHYSGVKTTPDFLLNMLKEVDNPYTIKANLAQLYQAGDRRISTLFYYAEYLGMQKNYSLQKEVTQTLFLQFKGEKLSTYQSYYTLKKLVIDSENGFFRHWLQHLHLLTGFEEGVHQGTEKQVLERILINEIISLKHQSISPQKHHQLQNDYRILGLPGQIEDYW